LWINCGHKDSKWESHDVHMKCTWESHSPETGKSGPLYTSQPNFLYLKLLYKFTKWQHHLLMKEYLGVATDPFI